MAQEEMKKRSKTRGKSKTVREYILTGFMTCECGRRMVGYSQKRSKESKRYFYYRCTGCNNSIRAEEIEDTVLKMLEEQIFDNIDELINKIQKYLLEQEKDKPNELRYLKNELNKTNEQIDNIVEMIMNGVNSIKLGQKLEELETYKEGIEDRINEVSKISVIPEDEIKTWLLEIKDSFNAGKNIKQIVALFVKEIRVAKDNYDIDFFIKSPYNNGNNGASCFSVSPSAPLLFAQTKQYKRRR